MQYIGNGAYCYANSMAMALAHAGREVAPWYLECLTAFAVSAHWEKGTPFFDSKYSAPDQGVGVALDSLGFTYVHSYHASEDDPEGRAPLALLRDLLGDGPVIIGPVDMGLLTYHPSRQYLGGVDHFVLLYEMDETNLFLHDPAGYPYTQMAITDFVAAWRAESIGYRTGSYTMWGRLREESHPDADALFARTDRQIAWQLRQERMNDDPTTVGAGAVRRLAAQVRENGAPGRLWDHLVHFALPLGAKRAADFARFYAPYDAERARAKKEEAKLFGATLPAMINQGRAELADVLEKLADQMDLFHERTLAINP